MFKVPTTREIADATGCNQSTVSRALANSPLVNPHTRKRIQDIARGLGWRPNPLASAYMSHLRGTRPASYRANLAFLHAEPPEHIVNQNKLANPAGHIRKHYEGARERALELGYHLDPIWLREPGMNVPRLVRMLRNRNVPGIIVSPIHHPVEGWDKFEWQHFASATMGYSILEPDINRVYADTLGGYNMLIEKAYELGYRRIGIVVPRELDELTHHTLLSAAYFQQKNMAKRCQIGIQAYGQTDNRKRSPDHAKRAEPKGPRTYWGWPRTVIPMIQQWLLKFRPQIVIGTGTEVAAIHEMNWRIPQDVAFMNVDRSPEYPDFAGFSYFHEKHGALAVDLVVAQLMNNERGLPKIPKCVMVAGSWEEGISAPRFQDIPKLGRSALVELPQI